MSAARRLRDLIASGETILVPGAYNAEYTRKSGTGGFKNADETIKGSGFFVSGSGGEVKWINAVYVLNIARNR